MKDASPEMLSIFASAVERPSPEERAAFLDTACGSDAELRGRIEALLRAHDEAGGFLRDRPTAREPVATIDQPAGEGPGSVIGPYKLLEQIGEGGFGVVYMAEQTQPVRRKVALKVLKPGMDTRQVVARFEAERQALAIMDHPHIAKVFDGGVTRSGRPYFVMELVKGIPLTDFCDQHQLTPRQRLELFVPVCQAVQHAHQKGIIHRDLKPSNVLVSRHDTTPVVKVIDFGVAKALGQELTDKTLFTGIAQMVGTPHYMSPEQAGMSDLDVDTRSDVYSLGVLLYELLTGTTPFTKERFKQAAYDEIRRIIREEEPPKPSTRLSESKDALASISAQRHTEPAKLTSLVRGELDWIVMKALEKDRNRRYESANGFAADVQRYLADEPVLACPPSVGYRLRKLVRRNKGPVLAVTLVVLALVGGIVGTTVGMLRAANEASQKNQALEDRTAALTSAEEQLFKALVQRARAERSSGSVGQRFEALKLIQKAARTRITPELRAEAAAALIRPDVEVVHEWEACPEGFLGIPAFDADFMRYARFDKQGEITVCRRTNGPEEILARLRSPGGPIAVGPWMSPDGRYLAVGYRGGAHAGAAEVRVYRLEGSRVEDAFLVPEGIHEWALAYRPDSRQVAIGHANGWVSVYDLERGVRVQRLQIGVSPLCLAFHPRDSRLTVATVNAVRLFDVDKEKELPALRHAVSVRRIESLAWHPDGVRLAVACLDRKIYLWDTRTATEVMTLVDGHEGNVLAFHPAGDLLLSTNYFYQSRVWDVATGRQLLQTPTAIGQQFSRDGRLVGISVAGTKARLWRVAPGRELRVLRRRNAGSLENLVCPVLHPNGRTLAACDRDWLSFFDVISGEELGTASLPHKEAAHPVFFVPPRRSSSQGQAEEAEETGGWMTGGIGSMLFWPTRFDPGRPSVLRVGPARRFVADSGAHSRYASASKDGRVVAVPQGSSTLVIHRDQPERRLVLGPQYDVRFSAVSPDGRWVYSGTHWYDGKSSTARIWDAQTGKLEHELPLDKSTDARFSPDGKWLLTISTDARLWQVDGWREVRRLSGGGTFSPDSRLLAVMDGMGVIRLEETATGREVARLTGPEPTWYRPECFTPGGTRLIAGDSISSALYVFDLRLIREGLKELRLDWDWPEFPKALPDETPRVTRVEILPGDLGKPALSREERAKQAIAGYRSRLEKNPNDAAACNNLAWNYLTAPEPLRDPTAALPLAEKAVELEAGSPVWANTLGLAYIRARRYREAVAALCPNLKKQEDACLGHDLYFLAICYHELGEPARARDYYDWATRWTKTHRGRNPDEVAELVEFRAEVEKLLGVKKDK